MTREERGKVEAEGEKKETRKKKVRQRTKVHKLKEGRKERGNEAIIILV